MPVMDGHGIAALMRNVDACRLLGSLINTIESDEDADVLIADLRQMVWETRQSYEGNE